MALGPGSTLSSYPLPNYHPEHQLFLGQAENFWRAPIWLPLIRSQTWEAGLLWSLKVALVKSLRALPMENSGILRKICTPQFLQVKRVWARTLATESDLFPICLCCSSSYDLDYKLSREDVPYR